MKCVSRSVYRRLGVAIILVQCAVFEGQARELWSDKSTSISMEQSISECSDQARFIVETDDIGLFEERLKDLQNGILPAIFTYTFNCKAIQSVSLIGKVSNIVVFNGEINQANNWRIAVKATPLELEAARLSSDVRSLIDVHKISKTLLPYKQINGFENTFQFFIYFDTARKLVQGILDRNGEREFEQLIDQTYATEKSAARLKWEMQKIISAVGLVLPAEKQKLSEELETRIADIVRNEWDTFLKQQLVAGTLFDATLDKIVKKAQSLEPAMEHGTALDTKLAAWLKNKISESNNIDFENYTQRVSSKKTLINALDRVNLTAPFVNSRNYIRSSLQRLEIEANEIEWDGFMTAQLEDGDIFEGTLSKIAQKANTVIPNREHGKTLDRKLQNWIDEEVSIYKSLTDGGFLSDIAERNNLANALAKTTLPFPFTKSQDFLEQSHADLKAANQDKLAELTTIALEVIGSVGESYEDLDQIIEESVALSSEFENNGFEAEAQQILKAASERIDNFITIGHTSLKAQIQSASMNRETIATYQEQATLFDTLSEQFSGFKPYVTTIEDGIIAGRKRECKLLTQKAIGGEPEGGIRINTFQGAVSLSDLACKLYVNDHILTEYKSGWLWQTATLSIDQSDGSRQTFKLRQLPDNKELTGIARIDGDTETSLTPDEWQSQIAALIIAPPSGKPNSQGITECDMLAADPSDPLKVTDGISLEDQVGKYDFERAIDSCIAAIEYTPDEPRNYYQLARVLNFVGMTEEAKSYAALASEAKYAAALHLNAEMQMFEEGFNDFEKVNEDFKQALNLGYLPSKEFIFDDSAVIFDENGIAEISCSTEQYIVDANGDIGFSMSGDLLFKINSKTMKIIPEYEQIMAYSNNVSALRYGKEYTYSTTDSGDIRFKAETVSRGNGSFFINQKSGQLNHKQGIFLRQFFAREFWGGYRINGVCFSEIEDG